MTLAAVDEVPTDTPQPDAEPEATRVRQLKFDGMPIAQNRVAFGGGVTVSEDAAKAWKLGQEVELTVRAVVSSRKHKAQTNMGAPTGDAEHQVTFLIVDIVGDDE